MPCPGVSPLKHRTIYELKKSDYEVLLKISKDIGINNYHEQSNVMISTMHHFGFERRAQIRNDYQKPYHSSDQNDLQRTIDDYRC